MDWFRGTEAELYEFANVKPKDPVQHTVQNGDTFKSVAEKYKITINELTIPVPTISKPNTGGGSSEITNTPKTHTVKQGESLGSIATKYGVTVDAIKAINSQISNPNLIFVGQVIVIP